MKNELKQLYKKDKKLAIEAAKVLGYKINVKAVENLADVYKKTKKTVRDAIINIQKRLSIHSSLFKKHGSSDSVFVSDLEQLNKLLEKASKYANDISKL